MPVKLTTTIGKIPSVPNFTNSTLIRDFYEYMVQNDSSERNQNNYLKVIIPFAMFLGPGVTFYEIKRKELITQFLDTKIKTQEEDPDRKWITTWNHNLVRIKHFFRWLYNYKKIKDNDETPQTEDNWETPEFAKIKQRKTKRISPYAEAELWERDDILNIIKYEPYKRNKAALSLFWDLDARNHEVTLLKIRHIRLKDRYGEGEIPYNTKTGGGPILLTCSFPYVRDWLNEHPFKNEPDARLICNLYNGGAINPEAMWTMMKQLRKRIIRLLDDGSITDEDERKRLEFILKTKRWNPYCIRHSAITSDSDYLTSDGLNKKVRWSMNTRQRARYIKRRMGNDLKEQILVHDGIMSETDIEKKPSVHNCPRCTLVNAIDNKFCSKCSYPLVPSAFDEIKAAEEIKFKVMEERFNSMQSQIQALIAAIGNTKDQNQLNNMARTLYTSGLLKASEARETMII
jgi:integrase/recombinase XerD